MSKDKIPCIQCPCIVICRSTYFMDMIKKCSLIELHLFETTTGRFGLRKKDFNERIASLEKVLKPEFWRTERIESKTTASGYVDSFSYRKGANRRTTTQFFYSGAAE